MKHSLLHSFELVSITLLSFSIATPLFGADGSGDMAATLRQFANLPQDAATAKQKLGALMKAAQALPPDAAPHAYEAVCAGLLAIGDVANYAKVKPRLPDAGGFESQILSDCDNCIGEGSVNTECRKCEGSGVCPNPHCAGGYRYAPALAGTAPMRTPCPVCKGSGKCPDCKGKAYFKNTCRTCRGSGHEYDRATARSHYGMYLNAAIAACPTGASNPGDFADPNDRMADIMSAVSGRSTKPSESRQNASSSISSQGAKTEKSCVIDGCKYVFKSTKYNGEYWSLEQVVGTPPSTLSIPSHIKGIPVTSIRPDKRDGFQGIRKLTIPETINEFSVGFGEQSELQEITFSGAPGNIGSFTSCPELKSVIVKGEEGEGCWISESDFTNCPKLKSLVFPHNSSVEKGAFTNCPLESVSFPDGAVCDKFPCVSFCGHPYEDFRVPALTSISEARLRNGKAKPGEMVFVDGVKYQFSESGLYVEAVDPAKSGPFAIPSSVAGHKVIGIRTFKRYYEFDLSDRDHNRKGIFQGCSGITSLEIPDGLSLSMNNIGGLSSLGKLILGRNVTVYGHDDLGLRFGTLTNIVIKGGGGEICAGGFVRCGNLRSIVLPREPMKIANEGFKWCNSLESVTYPDGELCLDYPKECFSGPLVEKLEQARLAKMTPEAIAAEEAQKNDDRMKAMGAFFGMLGVPVEVLEKEYEKETGRRITRDEHSRQMIKAGEALGNVIGAEIRVQEEEERRESFARYQEERRHIATDSPYWLSDEQALRKLQAGEKLPRLSQLSARDGNLDRREEERNNALLSAIRENTAAQQRAAAAAASSAAAARSASARGGANNQNPARPVVTTPGQLSPCPACGGSGVSGNFACPRCNGLGKTTW